jgi:hypothetical protein
MQTPQPDGPLVGMAVGRIVLGTLALIVPNALVRWFGLQSRPETAYLTRIYGGRAIALGLGYLTEPHEQRGRWQRLGVFVDAADTATAAGHFIRRDVPRSASVALGGLTGTYLLIGLLHTLRRTR